MVPNNAGNATLQIDPAAYVEQAVKPLETILIITFAFWGIYSVLFCIYLYFQFLFLRRSRKRPVIYPVLLLVLYILITAHTILSTLSFNLALTSHTIIELSFNPSFFSSVVSQQNPDLGYLEFLRSYLEAEICYMIANLVADGLLICRCYYLWDARKSVIIAPIILYILDLGSFIGALVAEASKERYFDPPFALGRPEPGPIGIPLKVSLAFAIGTIVTNVLLIALIAGRLFWLAKRIDSVYNQNCKTYSHLVVIILESGLLYPFTLIVGLCLTPVATLVELLPLTAQTMGIAPTLMMVLVDFNASVENVSEESSSQNV